MAAIPNVTITFDNEALRIIRELNERLDRMQAEIDAMPERVAGLIAESMRKELERRIHVPAVVID